MPDPQIRFEKLIAKLKERKYRLTPPRVELVRMISASAGHPSAAQLYERIKAQFPTMSLATVYKTLDLLKALGKVYNVTLSYHWRQGKHQMTHFAYELT